MQHVMCVLFTLLIRTYFFDINQPTSFLGIIIGGKCEMIDCTLDEDKAVSTNIIATVWVRNIHFYGQLGQVLLEGRNGGPPWLTDCTESRNIGFGVEAVSDVL